MNRFLFQNLDRVQLYDLENNLLADTDTLDLAQNIFIQNQNISEAPIDNAKEDLSETNNMETVSTITFNTENYVKMYSNGSIVILPGFCGVNRTLYKY